MSKMRVKNLLENNEKGYTLAIVLMVMLVFSVLGMSVMTMSMNSVKMSGGEREDQAVYYIAESGATIVMSEIEKIIDVISKCPEEIDSLIYSCSTKINNPSDFFRVLEQELEGELELDTFGQKTIATFEKNQGELPAAEVSLEFPESVGDSTSREYKITSKGKIGTRTRTIEGNFTVTYQGGSSGIEIPNNVSLFTTGTIYNSAQISGDIATTSTSANSIEVTSGSKISGNIYVQENLGVNALNMNSIGSKDPARSYFNGKIKNIETLDYQKNLNTQFPEFPVAPSYSKHPNLPVPGSNGKNYDFIKDGYLHHTGAKMNSEYEWNLNSNSYFEEFRVTDSKLKINIGNKDVTIVVKDFNVKGYIEIVGSGTLNIFVKNNITLGYGYIGSKDKVNNLNFYIPGQDDKTRYSTLKLDGGMEIFGSLFVDNVNLDLTAGAKIKGHVLSNGESLKLVGGSSAGNSLIFAPKAEVRIDRATGFDIIGTIISKSYYGSGGAHIRYGYIDTSKIKILSGSGQSKPNIFIEKQKVIEK